MSRNFEVITVDYLIFEVVYQSTQEKFQVRFNKYQGYDAVFAKCSCNSRSSNTCSHIGAALREAGKHLAGAQSQCKGIVMKQRVAPAKLWSMGFRNLFSVVF